VKFRKPLCPPGQLRATTDWKVAAQLERDVIASSGRSGETREIECDVIASVRDA
jgi:hypothetical protein